MSRRFLEREIEEYRGRWRAGDPTALGEFEEELREPLRRIARRLFRAGRFSRSQLAASASEKTSAGAVASVVGEDRVSVAVHRLASALLSGGRVEVVARDTALGDLVATHVFSPESAERQALLRCQFSLRIATDTLGRRVAGN